MNAKLTLLVISILCVARFGSSQTIVPPQYFGMHYVKSQPWPSVPFGSLRLWDTDTRWQQMNTARGVYDFSTLDDYLALAHAHGLSDVLLVLGGTPNWISSQPFNTWCDYTNVAPGSCAPPADLNSDGTGTNQAWRSFVYQLTSHVAALNTKTYSQVAAYEMWNEFSRSTESWTGSQAQMLRMAQDAYCVLKGSTTITATGENCTAESFHVPAVGLQPDAIVTTPSAQAFGADLNALTTYLSLSLSSSLPGAIGPNSTSADVIATHNYTYRNGCCAFAEIVASHWSALRAALPAKATGLPVWSTEGSWGDTATKEPDLDMQSAYVARVYLLGWSAGFKRMYWYAWGNSWGRLWSQSGINGCNDLGSGAGCTSPAASAYANVYSWMAGNIMTRPCAFAGSVYSCPLTRPEGTKTLAVWDASKSCTRGVCAHSSYLPSPGYGSYLDLANVRHILRGRWLEIGAKPVLLISNTRTSGHNSTTDAAPCDGATSIAPQSRNIARVASTSASHQ